MGRIQNCINIANTGKAPLLWGTNPGVHLFICLYKFNSCAKKKKNQSFTEIKFVCPPKPEEVGSIFRFQWTRVLACNMMTII